MDSENEGVDNEILPPEKKGYSLRNHPTKNYNYGRPNQRSMGWNDLVIGSHAPHSVVKAYVNVINDISNFVEPNPPTNIITNETILNEYSIKQGLNFLVKTNASLK